MKRDAAEVNGVMVVGKPIEEAAIALKQAFSFSMEAVFGDGDDSCSYGSPDLAISFWVEDGAVEAISWSEIVSDEGGRSSSRSAAN